MYRMGAQPLCSAGVQVTVTSVLPMLLTLTIGGVMSTGVLVGGIGVSVGGAGVSVGGTGVLVPVAINVVNMCSCEATR